LSMTSLDGNGVMLMVRKLASPRLNILTI